jgi:hypothetical protein
MNVQAFSACTTRAAAAATNSNPSVSSMSSMDVADHVSLSVSGQCLAEVGQDFRELQSCVQYEKTRKT